MAKAKRNIQWQKHDRSRMARVTPISRVTDFELWNQLVTALTKAHLGEYIESYPEKWCETTAGLFPGDELTNLNDHRLFGGQLGFVRYPPSRTVYRFKRGVFIVKVEGTKFEAAVWYCKFDRHELEPGFKLENLQTKSMELGFRAALRDRRFDGTKDANDCALSKYPYDDPVHHKRLPVADPSVELSIYGFLPGTSLEQDGDSDYDQFVRNPYSFLNRPERFRQLFDRVLRSTRSPGQNARPIDDVAEDTPGAFENIARRHGYKFIEVAPSHYHVARWAFSVGYRYRDRWQADVMGQFADGIKKIKQARKIERNHESWICVVQSLRLPEINRPDLIPEGLDLNGPVWPQDNMNPQLLWMYKPLDADAATRLPHPHPYQSPRS